MVPSMSIICGSGSKIEKFTIESDEIANSPMRARLLHVEILQKKKRSFY
jgi:hypothetical protein